MKILERMRNRSSRGQAGAPGSAEASSADEQRLPIARYDQLDGKQLIPQLSQLSQEELAAVEAHERSRLRSGPPTTRAELDGPPAMKTKIHHSPFDRVDAARDERNERERLRDEARYRRERLELYRARLYGGHAASQSKLRELQRASDGAAARLRRAEAAATLTHPPT